MIKKEIRDKIVSQALSEIEFARKHKQGKIGNWAKNESMYYGVKVKSDDSRANVELGRMQEFVHTLMSKIDEPLKFKFVKRKPAQKPRVERLNSLASFDANRDFWDLKDLVGKKQGILYGRAMYAYHADSQDGYTPHLENIDVYDFLIDPSAGGIDIDKAMFMGRYGVVKTKSQLKADKGLYIKTEINKLIDGHGNADENSTEENNKKNRTSAQNVTDTDKQIVDPDKYKFWEWYTTYNGVRYYLLLNENGARAIRCEELKDVFANNDWPIWTWAAFPDLTEFWTPSYADFVREIFMAQSVSVNQMLDNAEQINKPQKLVDVTALENLADIKYKKGGVIRTKGGVDVQKAMQIVETPSIKTPLDVYATLESIQEKALGITAASKGVADTGGKATIYEGNQANTADRFGLLNKSYAFGYRRFASLYENGVREHLSKKMAIDVLGPNGIDIKEISKKDIFWKNDKFGVQVESSAAEEALSIADKRAKLNFLQSQNGSPVINPQKSVEIQGQISGMTEEQMRELLDVSEFGDANLMAEADRDIERILEGEVFKPNLHANTAYLQRFVDYFTDHEEDITAEQFAGLERYMASLNPIVVQNMVRELEIQKLKQQAMQISLAEDPNGVTSGGNPTNPADDTNPLNGGGGRIPKPRRIIEETSQEITSNQANQF